MADTKPWVNLATETLHNHHHQSPSTYLETNINKKLCVSLEPFVLRNQETKELLTTYTLHFLLLDQAQVPISPRHGKKRDSLRKTWSTLYGNIAQTLDLMYRCLPFGLSGAVAGIPK